MGLGIDSSLQGEAVEGAMADRKIEDLQGKAMYEEIITTHNLHR